MDFENFRDWLPVRLYWKKNQPFVDWCYLGKKKLTESFFDDSILKRFREPFNLLFRHQTPLEFLGELDEYSKGLPPTGFIFHLSRCGSTLVSQMFAALPQNIVISEASPIDFVLRAKKKSVKIPENQRVEWLRWVINSLGQKRNPDEKHYFIKFDSWNTLDLSLIKQAYPDVPWIFLYRNPFEIIVSHLREPGAQMIPGLIKEILPEVALKSALRMPPEEYCARVLERICQKMLDFLPDQNGLPVNYTQLPDALTTIILKHFGVVYKSQEIEKMKLTVRFNSKTPQLKFVADDKTAQATENVLRAADRFVNPVYRQLEKMRLANSPKSTKN